MSDPGRLRRELRALLAHGSDALALDRLCAGAVSALPVDGAAISLTTDAGGRGYTGASDPVSAHLDDLQFTLGEGPCWDAARHGHPVLVGDLTGQAARRWPMFTPAVLAAGYQAIFAFPLQIGAIRLGILDLLRVRPGPLDGDALADALIVADVATLTLIDTAAVGSRGHGDPLSGPGPDIFGMYRAEVHQATGMVMAQLGVSAQEALVRLRAHAYAAGRTADEVARDIVARRLRLDGGRLG
ncbi:GAF and ANTAR domain-containing protein [Frankia sp. CNm7]|uniref:GAF and ANTAR domain-containing protein n=1 Tax=Frankia nepalensis TaxID=1836974 RepID=A0A937RJ07_9ACTN|nr:GAF and ANTAR domain-containing protein [Frankia nepalensis]MBL7502565.1 GAF and ANTAR domain-containing protein [Frankia nepalensis]MBL7515144.1 GAF and ANTAR domain-containing protein [Frankia nepalensis]MBL7521282.1 GAF and ANTAR domain-containing protein [Frankia nepalensis]MBL7633153.1 GAF and ANTAR domain-containing protein [Frankia nepalensis]